MPEELKPAGGVDSVKGSDDTEGNEISLNTILTTLASLSSELPRKPESCNDKGEGGDATAAESSTNPSIKKASELLSMPIEILDMIVHLVYPDFTSRLMSARHVDEIEPPHLLFVCQQLRRSALQVFRQQKLTIFANQSRPYRLESYRALKIALLQQAKEVRIVCSEVGSSSLGHPDDGERSELLELAKIWGIKNAMLCLELFVPPHYESLPQITHDPRTERLFRPIIRTCADIIVWIPTDFAGYSTAFGTALFTAIMDGNFGLVEFILEKSLDGVNKPCFLSLTPLQLAIYNGRNDIVERLLATRTIDINVAGRRGTALHMAAEHNNTYVVRLLLETGNADLSSLNRFGKTPLQIAHERRHETLVRMLSSAQYTDN